MSDLKFYPKLSVKFEWVLNDRQIAQALHDLDFSWPNKAKFLHYPNAYNRAAKIKYLNIDSKTRLVHLSNQPEFNVSNLTDIQSKILNHLAPKPHRFFKSDLLKQIDTTLFNLERESEMQKLRAEDAIATLHRVASALRTINKALATKKISPKLKKNLEESRIFIKSFLKEYK